MSGACSTWVEVCRQLRAVTPAVVIVMTTPRREVDVVLGRDAGADDYLTSRCDRPSWWLG